MKIRYITNRKTKRIAIYYLDELNPDVVTIYCIRPVGAFLRRETITLEWKELIRILKHMPRPIRKPLIRKPLP